MPRPLEIWVTSYHTRSSLESPGARERFVMVVFRALWVGFWVETGGPRGKSLGKAPLGDAFRAHAAPKAELSVRASCAAEPPSDLSPSFSPSELVPSQPARRGRNIARESIYSGFWRYTQIGGVYRQMLGSCWGFLGEKKPASFVAGFLKI